MELFTIKDNGPYPSPEALLIPEFRALWSRDKATNRMKPQAVEDLAYVYFMADYQSPYRAYPTDERKKEIRKDIIKTRPQWKEDDTVRAAMEKYDRLQETDTMRLLKAVDKTLAGLTDYFDNLNFDPNKKDNEGRPVKVSDAKKAMEAVAQIPKLVASIHDLRDKVKKEQNIGTTIRGGGAVGSYEK